ncbi:hypothetical protein BIW11_08866 [Tropilaelaps mercedesae]|uniref:CAP-Gly domain-containing protein n=1 Tax=Tropilaelaps mercedesae TaxID=418985 RepID=A0A1V9XMZ0_9ACAR|nr:hypothetical protein BIW11_08866 [Tropilaelaps mercedesae]
MFTVGTYHTRAGVDRGQVGGTYNVPLRSTGPTVSEALAVVLGAWSLVRSWCLGHPPSAASSTNTGQASRMMLLRQGPVRPSKVLLENGGFGVEDDTSQGGAHEKIKKVLPERSPTFVRRPRSDLSPGVRVVVKGAKMGTIRYVGEIRFAPGTWCGVELDEPVGRHNGEKYGVRYFYCRNNHGIYVPAYKVFPLGRLIEEVSLCSISFDEPWSLDMDCASLVSRKSGRLEEFLHETRLSEVDIWRLLSNQQQQYVENCNPDNSMSMSLSRTPLRGTGIPPRSQGSRPLSPRGPESLTSVQTSRAGRPTKQLNSSKSDPPSLQTCQVTTSKNRVPARKVLGPSNSSLDARKAVVTMDLVKKNNKPVASLQQPRSKPMASRASMLRESFIKIKETLPTKQLGKQPICRTETFRVCTENSAIST